jgi:HD superfamily phosphohydrolase
LIREKLYRDPVHDLISLDQNSADDRCIIALIDSPEVQRLRRIRQLGLASVAYPGAEHSRFTHSLGVMWTATRILEHLGRTTAIPPQQALAVRCAALLHDVGHGPLSHVFEKFTLVHHEEWTRRVILDPACTVNRILSAHRPSLPQEVVAIIEGRSHPLFLSQVISSQLDADRFDYLLRDSHMTGVKYGVFDFERLLRMLRLDPSGRQIVVARPGVHPVEGYLQSRFHMYAQVYLHKTVRAAEAVLGLTLRRAAELAALNRLADPECDPLTRLLQAAGRRLVKDSRARKKSPSNGAGIAVDSLPTAQLWADKESKVRTLGKSDRSAGMPSGQQASATAEEPTLADYLEIDDHVVFGALKRWRQQADPVLSDMAGRVLERRVFKTVDVSRTKGLQARLRKARTIIAAAGGDPRYHLFLDESGDVPYRPYDRKSRKIGKQIFIEPREPGGEYLDIAEVSEVVAGLARAAFTTRRVMFPGTIGNTDLRALLVPVFTDQEYDHGFLPPEA